MSKGRMTCYKLVVMGTYDDKNVDIVDMFNKEHIEIPSLWCCIPRMVTSEFAEDCNDYKNDLLIFCFLRHYRGKYKECLHGIADLWDLGGNYWSFCPHACSFPMLLNNI